MQKVIGTVVLVIASFFSSHGQENTNFTITVNMTGMKSDKGDVYVALYNAKKDFLKTTFKTSIVKIVDQKATAIFTGLEKGVYAISVFHDKNDNKKMDTNFLGIPKEPIGMSNDAKAFMGPPKFKDAKFMVAADVVLSIRIK
ncbi:MAG: DUF2141 domain-containing protein [Polaribacter sp.]|jgi:uncharacterized protein (DUF2141 family)|nr:DUF2141 domain-containing protein [Polaribacter sp.]MDG1953570.1 DUF2141 domain-containing protein [Polaribacter sp.]MDG2073316.1 DUF2141 domain-containing protein [Polaribacter sp.]